MKENNSLIIDNYLLIKANTSSNLTFYISNNIEIKRFYKEIKLENLVSKNYNLEKEHDIVIPGLGFIKVASNCNLDISLIDGVNIFIRDSLI